MLYLSFKGCIMRNTLFMLLVCASAGFAVGLTGCQPTSRAKDAAAMADIAPDQSHVCEVHDWKAAASASACHAEQKIVFLPDSWGNEQLPILFVAVNCDLRYSVALTVGGVSCIYVGPLAPDRLVKPAEGTSAPTQPASGRS
jgi:hypothetical protein